MSGKGVAVDSAAGRRVKALRVSRKNASVSLGTPIGSIKSSGPRAKPKPTAHHGVGYKTTQGSSHSMMSMPTSAPGVARVSMGLHPTHPASAHASPTIISRDPSRQFFVEKPSPLVADTVSSLQKLGLTGAGHSSNANFIIPSTTTSMQFLETPEVETNKIPYGSHVFIFHLPFSRRLLDHDTLQVILDTQSSPLYAPTLPRHLEGTCEGRWLQTTPFGSIDTAMSGSPSSFLLSTAKNLYSPSSVYMQMPPMLLSEKVLAADGRRQFEMYRLACGLTTEGRVLLHSNCYRMFAGVDASGKVSLVDSGPSRGQQIQSANFADALEHVFSCFVSDVTKEKLGVYKGGLALVADFFIAVDTEARQSSPYTVMFSRAATQTQSKTMSRILSSISSDLQTVNACMASGQSHPSVIERVAEPQATLEE